MRCLIILSGVICLSFMLLSACAPQAEQQAEPVADESRVPRRMWRRSRELTSI